MHRLNLAKQEKWKCLSDFEELLKEIEFANAGRVKAGEWSETEAAQRKADWVYQEVLEKTRDTSFSMALFMVLFNMLSMNITVNFNELQSKYEHEITGKLVEHLNIN